LTKLNRGLLVAALLATLIITSFPLAGITNVSATIAGWNNQNLPGGNMRQTPLNVRIVFVGITQRLVNISDGYFQWNLPPYHIQRETCYGTNWGVNYTFSYSYSFNQTFDTSFFAYIQTIKKDVAMINPWDGGNRVFRFYNANKVEDWLYNNPQGYGGIPNDGYALFLINVTYWDIGYDYSMLQHYYNLTYSDIDSKLIVTNDWYGQWMTSWGGHYRLYFTDVSAGVAPPLKAGLSQTWWNHYFRPVWNLGLNFATKNGRNFLNEYLAEFASGTIYDLFSADFLYPPRIAPNLDYNITITIFDNCTWYFGTPIEDPSGGYHPGYGISYAINKSAILNAFNKLVPYATWTVNVKYIHLNGTGDASKYSSLWSAIKNAQRTIVDTYGVLRNYVDRDQLYHYLQLHLSDFVTQETGQLLIPVFTFVFQNPYNLGYMYEGYDYDYYWGFGYPDVVLVSHDVTDLLGGFGLPAAQGFTQTIIHEVGHAVGLMHPFWYDYQNDYVASEMAYYPHEYIFSQFDRDAIQRGHADYYIIRAQSMMENATWLKGWKQLTPELVRLYNNAYGNLTQALTHYNAMDYPDSFFDARTASTLFTQFVSAASGQPSYDDVPPVLSNLQMSPISPLPSNQVTVNITVLDAISGVKNVTLYYQVNTGSWQTLPMTNISASIYNATIPQASAGSTVYFYVTSYDNNNNLGSTTIHTYVVQSPPSAAAAPSIVSIAIVGGVLFVVGLAIGVVLMRKFRR
jgi:hypothetical protein